MSSNTLKYLGVGIVIIALGCISFSTSFTISLYKSESTPTPSRTQNTVTTVKTPSIKVVKTDKVSKINTPKEDDTKEKNHTNIKPDKNIHQEDTINKKIISSNKDTKDIEERHQIKHNNVSVNENPVVTTSISYSNQNNGQTTGVTKEVIIP